MSHVDVKNLKPSSFEEEHYDEYDYYSLTDKYARKSLLSVRDVLFCGRFG